MFLTVSSVPVQKAPVFVESIWMCEMKFFSNASDELCSSLVGSMLWRIMQHQSPADCIYAGLLASQKSLRHVMAVPNTISPDTLSREEVQKWREKYCIPKVVVWCNIWVMNIEFVNGVQMTELTRHTRSWSWPICFMYSIFTSYTQLINTVTSLIMPYSI